MPFLHLAARVAVTLLLLLSGFTALAAQCGAEPTGENTFSATNAQSVVLSKQSDLDAFLAPNGEKYTRINASIVLDGANTNDPIVDLCNLAAAKSITSLNIRRFNSQNGLREVVLPQLSVVDQLLAGHASVNSNHALRSIRMPLLEKVKGQFQILFANVLTKVDFSSLRSVGSPENAGIIRVKNCPKLREFSLPNLEDVFDPSGFGATSIQGKSLTSVDLGSQASGLEIGGKLFVFGDYDASSFDRAAVNLGKLRSARSINVLFESTSGTVDHISVDLGGLQKVREDLGVFGANDVVIGNVNVGGDVTVNGPLKRLVYGKGDVGQNLTIRNNRFGALAISVGVSNVGGGLSISSISSEHASATLNLPNLIGVAGNVLISTPAKAYNFSKLRYVKGDLDLYSAKETNKIATPLLRQVGGRLWLTQVTIDPTSPAAEKTLDFGSLSKIGKDFRVIRQEGLRSLAGFGSLTEVGEFTNRLTVTDNPDLAACCVLPCQVSLNGLPLRADDPLVTISDNAGDCTNAQTLFNTCGPDATFSSTVTRYRTIFTANTANAISYRWTVNGNVVSTSDTYEFKARYLPLGVVICLEVTTNCGTGKHCIGVAIPGPDDVLGPGKSLTNNGMLSVAPNPFSQSFTLHLPPGPPTTVRLFATTGQLVREQMIAAGEHDRQLDFSGSDLPAGVYYLRATAAGQPVITQKVVKH